MTVPALLLAPSPLMIRQWRLAYDIGAKVNPPIAVASALSFSCLAYRLSNTISTRGGSAGKLYTLAAAAAITISIVPYTLTVMRRVNRTLLSKAKETENLKSDEVLTEIDVAERESAKQLIDLWGVLNFGRGLLPAVGSVLGYWAALL